MILLHGGEDARQRIGRIIEAVAGDVFRNDPSDNPGQVIDKISAWLNAAGTPEAIVLESSGATGHGDTAAYESLRKVAKFRGVDVHIFGDDTLESIADRVIESDDDLQITAPGSSVGSQIAELQRTEVMTDFERIEMDVPDWQDIMATSDCTEQEARAQVQWIKNQSVWANSLYQVNIEYLPEGRAHLIIRRLDKQPIHNWQHFQMIKSALLDPECEAVEVYPKESQLVDEKHHYHLWAFRSPDRSFGIGFQGGRKVR